jgi:Holliday junction resolvasome RuvABC endonuclease subunit
MIRQLLALDEIPKPDDAADGLGVAITDLNSSRYERMAR